MALIRGRDPPRLAGSSSSEAQPTSSLEAQIVASSTPRTPPHSPARNGVSASFGWNLPTQPLRQVERRSGERWPYALFGAVTLLIACVAMAVVMLAR